MIGAKSCQYFPYLIIDRERIPLIKIDDGFTYLRKDFNFGMDCTKIQDNIIDKIWKYIRKIHVLPSHPRNKVLIVFRSMTLLKHG